MVGLELPVVPVEHQYIVTGAIPELAEYNRGNPELAVLRENVPYYMRQEADGLILGPYEGLLLGTGRSSGRFGQELLAPDVERLEPHVIAAGRGPLFESAGMENVSRPIAYTPDGNPIVGPAGLRNFYLSEGVSFGITAAGGSGKFLAEWIIEGHASIDMLGVTDVTVPLNQPGFHQGENEEAYEHVFIIITI